MDARGRNLTEVVIADSIDDAFCESTGEKQSGITRTDTARLQVEERICVELADRRAVACADVVRVDFELGLGVDTGMIGEQKVWI